MLDFTSHSPSISLYWLLRTIIILIALQQWDSTRSGYAGQVTAVASVKPPGGSTESSEMAYSVVDQNVSIDIADDEPTVVTQGQQSRGNIHFIDDRMLASMDKCKISTRDAMHLITATAAALLRKIEGVNPTSTAIKLDALVLNRTTIQAMRRDYRRKQAQQILESFNIPEVFVLHWDGKLLPEVKGKEKSERLALVVTGKNVEKLLGIPKMQDSSGESIADTIFNLLIKWKMDNLVEIISFDTTASNTGINKGAAYLLEKKLKRDLLFLPCRHHISELLIRAVFELNFGKTAAPEVLIFNRFSKFWPNINQNNFKSGISDEDVEKLFTVGELEYHKIFCLEALKSQYVRADYKEVLQISLLFIGEKAPGFSGFRAPGATTHARFMSKNIYCFKMFLFREQFKLTTAELNSLRNICVFLTRIYVPYWFGCVKSVNAPRLDLQLINDVTAYYDTNISIILLKKIINHLWYLSEEAVALSFFDDQIPYDIKLKMVNALGNNEELYEEDISKKIKTTIEDVRAYTEKNLSDFVSAKTKRFFTRLQIDCSFLHSDPVTWKDRDDFCAGKIICENLAVVNDAAERGVKLITDFNRALTYDEEDKQYLLQVVEHYRKIHPSHTKSSLVNQIVDAYTVLLVIQNAGEQKSWYQCMVGNQAIGATELYVGTLPQNVMDFSCLVYDYQYMQCSFTRPKNMLLTRFDLEYSFDDDNSIHKCDLHEIEDDTEKLQCNISVYFPVRDKYSFTLMGVNAGGENTQRFTINNHEIVIPSALDVNVINVNSENVTLTWEKHKIGYYRKGLRYDIQIRDNNSNWHIPEMADEQCQNGICNIMLRELYAFWPYIVKVRVMSKSVNKNDERLWSEPSTKSFRTKGRRPYKAPDAPWGSFYIDSTETQLRLYWGRLDESDHCGPGFHYIVDEIGNNGVVIHSTRTSDTTMVLPWKNDSIQVFSIKAANDFGVTSEGNPLRVYRSGSHRYELNENNIAKVYHNSSYTLSWTPPGNFKELVNYTVFWCLPKIELPNQCKGPISYKYLAKWATNFTTDPKDRSLNLAISANYLNYNKGMQWARCSGDVSSELMKTELEVNVLNESAVFVKWSSGSVCSSILKGYNLTYCQASEDGHCLEQKHTILLLREYRNYTISHLQPYKKVCVSMYMYSPTKRGVDSDLCVRTKASAPSSPKHLSPVPHSLTSSSASISWGPPDAPNGIMSHYTIHWRQINDGSFIKHSDVPINQTSFILTGLNSSSTYDVHVTASTIKESMPSEHIKVSTLVGFPSSPRNIQIDENDKVISWDKPDIPPGRQVFYIVALLRRQNGNESIYDRVSIVRGRSCRFQLPDCSNPKESLALEVRAVDVANFNETDTDVSSMSQDVILAGATIVDSFCESDDSPYWYKRISFDERNKKFLASPWEQARKYFCFSGSKASIYAVAFVIAIAFSVYTCYWIRNKYYKMKNIKVILPEGLVDQVSNYKFGGDTLSNGCNLESSAKKEFHYDISRSNDCLVAFGHKDNHNLISNFHNRSTNALSSLSSNNSPKAHLNDDQVGEHPSLETTNEELSSNSSSNSNLTYHNHHHIERFSSVGSANTLPVSEDDREVERDETLISPKEYVGQTDIQDVNIDDGGYVTHNTQLLASLLNASERSVPSATQFPTFPAMTNDGYIQPNAAKQMFQPQVPVHPAADTVTLNGYTSIEALDKLSTMPHEAMQNRTLTSPISPPSHHSLSDNLARHNLSASPVITEIQESDRNKDINLLTTNVPTVACANRQPNNNNNTIYGYVTQQQLANFGTNVALGKELNT